ncbi:helix-turn-helix domain-containing protein [Saccharothrix variisporea]|uniref:Helix-turn-helix protein n=1 Tax=Saccharothrix variisporea TaxID=543527 RepID=A0A495XLQ4_9PSEU|nr:helix-turn-helix domain-containing protein [Saccharothrix variisporea]RKT75047.1 helix-turn-helix protein [Saccharothrix variisporea]
MDGGFGPALRAAVERSGLTLDAISRRLRAAGTPVSTSALSYWQNGATRPRSAEVVAALEVVLDQPPGALTGLLGPRRRADPPAAVPHELVMRRPETVARALAKLDATPEDLHSPHRLSQHLTYRVDAPEGQETMRVRRLVRADRDDTTRFLFVARGGSLAHPPAVTHAQGCRPHRFRADVPSATRAFEFLLDRPLAAGQLAYVEFGLRLPPDRTSRHAQLALCRPGREVGLRVVFSPTRLPTTCHAFFRPRHGLPAVRRSGAELDRATGTCQFVALDPEPGQYGIGWTW